MDSVNLSKTPPLLLHSTSELYDTCSIYNGGGGGGGYMIRISTAEMGLWGEGGGRLIQVSKNKLHGDLVVKILARMFMVIDCEANTVQCN